MTLFDWYVTASVSIMFVLLCLFLDAVLEYRKWRRRADELICDLKDSQQSKKKLQRDFDQFKHTLKKMSEM